jgi:hemerythrin-like domain-containing protein
MNDPISAWHAEHVYFSHLLDLLQRELDVFHFGGRPNYELAQDIIGYLHDYGDQYHHPREDRVFERLAKRSSDLQLVVARLRQQHRVIARAAESLLEQIEAILDDAVVPRSQLEMALATYLVYYRSHIDQEDALIVERAAHELTPADWEVVQYVPGPGRDVSPGLKSVDHFRELRRQIALEA